MLMLTILVASHVIAMISSMILMAGAVGLGLSGKRVAALMATIGFYTTVVGFITGGLLLFGSPLSMECVVLTAYLIGATLLYHRGFAFGDASRAALIRQS